MKNIEGTKESDGKLNYELDFEFIAQMAEKMSLNKTKYEPYNWKKPIDVELLKQSLFRHVIEIMKDNYEDDNRPFGHLESASLNCMMINYQLKNENTSNAISFEIETLNIDDILKNYDITPDILKIDCEGCEYSIVKNMDLSMFNEIFLEYHAKIVGISYDVIIEKLKEQGFKIKHQPTLNLPIEEIGIIHAFK